MLENAYVDADNAIHGRSAVQRINMVPFSDGTGKANSGDVHSHRLEGAIRYIGVGSIVCRTIPAPSPYAEQGRVVQGPTIISGLSGKRLTMASMSPSPGTSEPWTYFANGDDAQHGAASGDCRKKDNNNITRNWGIDGPHVAVTVALADSQPETILVDNFNAGYAPLDGNGIVTGAPYPYSGTNSMFTVPTGKTERYLHAAAVDMSPFTEDGYVRIMLRVDRIQNLDHVELAFNVSATSGVIDDFYQHPIPALSFQKDNVWQEFKFRKSEFERVKPAEGSTRNWADVSEVQVTVASAPPPPTVNVKVTVEDSGPPPEEPPGPPVEDPVEIIVVKVSAADLRIQDDTHPEGLYDYRLTWWNDDLKIRSNSRSLTDLYAGTSRTSEKIKSERQRITVDRTDVTTADPQVTHWELWRRNHEGGGIFAYLERIPIWASTYDDDKQDFELGELLIDDNEIPPTGRFIIWFDDRIFIMGMSSRSFSGGLVFTGTGLDDLTMNQGYHGNTTLKFLVVIDGVGTPNTFKYSIDEGASFVATGIPITTTPYDLWSGQTIQFAAATGHTLNDQWTFAAVKTGEEEARYSVRYSRRFRAESFPLENYFLAGNPIDVIRGCQVWQNQLWIWTKRNVYRVNPIDNSYLAQVTEAPVGTDSPYSISGSPFGIFYYAPEDGPYVFDGATAVPIGSQQLDPFFGRERFAQDGIDVAGVAMNIVAEFENVIGQYYNRFFWLTVDDEDRKCLALIYNCEAKRWHRVSGRGMSIRRLSWAKGGDDIATADNLEGGTSDGLLCLYEPIPQEAADFDDEVIPITVQQTFGSILKPEDTEVDIKGILVDAELQGQGMLVEASFDDGPLTVIGSQTGGPRQRFFFPLLDLALQRPEQGRICYKISIRLSIAQQTHRVVLFGLGVRYWPEPRRDLTYSAQWLAPSEEAWARRGRLVTRSYAPVEMILSFDAHEVYRVTLPNTEGERLGVNPSFPTGLRGKVAQVRFLSAAPWVLYPQSYLEMGSFGLGTQGLMPWQLTP
jgi:hypothetical protein